MSIPQYRILNTTGTGRSGGPELSIFEGSAKLFGPSAPQTKGVRLSPPPDESSLCSLHNRLVLKFSGGQCPQPSRLQSVSLHPLSHTLVLTILVAMRFLKSVLESHLRPPYCSIRAALLCLGKRQQGSEAPRWTSRVQHSNICLDSGGFTNTHNKRALGGPRTLSTWCTISCRTCWLLALSSHRDIIFSEECGLPVLGEHSSISPKTPQSVNLS